MHNINKYHVCTTNAKLDKPNRYTHSYALLISATTKASIDKQHRYNNIHVMQLIIHVMQKCGAYIFHPTY